MQHLNKLLDLLDDLERSASCEGCEADQMVVSATALWDAIQAAKLIKADIASLTLNAAPAQAEAASVVGTESSGMTVERFQKVSARLLVKHYGLQLNDTMLHDEMIVQHCVNQGFRPYQVIAEHANEADLARVDLQGPYGVPSKDAITAADEDAVLVLNDRYADSIIGEQPDRYDAVEIHGVRDQHAPGDPLGTWCEVDDENPQFFSVYVHLRPSATSSGLECVGDFETHSLAEQYAKELGEKYGWPVSGFVPVAVAQRLAA